MAKGKTMKSGKEPMHRMKGGHMMKDSEMKKMHKKGMKY